MTSYCEIHNNFVTLLLEITSIYGHKTQRT